MQWLTLLQTVLISLTERRAALATFRRTSGKNVPLAFGRGLYLGRQVVNQQLQLALRTARIKSAKICGHDERAAQKR